jgi:hypothetical protein
MTIYHDKPYGTFGNVVGGIYARGRNKFEVGLAMSAEPVGHVLGFPLLFFSIFVEFAWNMA